MHKTYQQSRELKKASICNDMEMKVTTSLMFLMKKLLYSAVYTSFFKVWWGNNQGTTHPLWAKEEYYLLLP